MIADEPIYSITSKITTTKNRKIRGLGSIYSEFKHNFHTITSGDNDHLGIPLPPKTLECCKQLFAAIGRPEECAIQFWEHTQSLRRPITRFQTLANNSINKQRSVSPKLRLQVLQRDGFKCAFCGRGAEDTALHVDHIHPVSKGGRNDIRLVPVDNSLIFINFMNRLRAKRTDSLTNRFFLLSIRPV